MEIRHITTAKEMAALLPIVQLLYPRLTSERYLGMLNEMIPSNYSQIAAFQDDMCIGVSGCWINTKLWSGRFLELDNFVVHPDHRSKKVGKAICDYAETLALENNCSSIVLDSYTTNFAAHKFFYNHGFVPKGFHFVRILDQAAFH